MAKMIGFACALRLPWLNKAAQMREDHLTVDEYKAELNQYLSFEIDEGTTRLRKTRDILMNVWYYESEAITPIRDEAYKLLEKYPEHANVIQLCMLYSTYPVFADICSYMGRLLEFQDDVTNAQLNRKLFDAWGERGSLEPTCRRVSLTLKELGILTPITKVRYAPVMQKIAKDDLIAFVLSTAMRIDGGSYYSYTELSDFKLLFPIEFEISKEMLMLDERFTVTTFGGESSVSLSERM